MKTSLVYKNHEGKVLRTFGAIPTEDRVRVIYRYDSRRITLIPANEELDFEETPHEVLATFNPKELKTPFSLGALGEIEFIDENLRIDSRVETSEPDRTWWRSFVFSAVFLIGIASVLVLLRGSKVENVQKIEEHVVKVLKRSERLPVTRPQNQLHSDSSAATSKSDAKSPGQVKRTGALAVLGQLKGLGKGGINLGAAVTSPGPGLGGAQGSGGVQTSLYGKGLIGAALGPGAKAEGGGGYGTKGKGGGQAGYGSLSLVGSSGADALSLSKEAVVEGGLDRDAIAAVIAKNIGQIRFCYEIGLQSDPKLTGRVLVDFAISPNGQVAQAGVANTTLNFKATEDCILMRLKSWKFPIPAGEATVKVSYPFVLKRVGG